MLRGLEEDERGGRSARTRSRDTFSLKEGHEGWWERAEEAGSNCIGASRVQEGNTPVGITHLLGSASAWNNVKGLKHFNPLLLIDFSHLIYYYISSLLYMY